MSDIFKDINKVEKIAALSKVMRLLNNPYKYISALFFRQFIYPRNKREKIIVTTLFYGRTMKIALPAATDIYLTGGKSHHSEIRLARFILLNLKEGDHFLDIGAHYGYFTLLASERVGNTGKVIAFEPTGKSYEILKDNSKSSNNIVTFQKAVADTTDTLVFYEFPNMHSEYNSSDVTQFEQESWYRASKPVKVDVQATTIDEITATHGLNPHIIKIDVEGGEFNVMKGGYTYLQNRSPFIVMEYLEPKRHNSTHKKALELLLSWGYEPYIINSQGSLETVADVDQYLTSNGLESDNVVFQK